MPKSVPNTQTGSLTDHEHGANDALTADGNGNTRIAFDANNGVTLVGISDPHILHASDFIPV
jgi:hypothetical protein